jgi:hypothetical protein
MKSEIDVVVRLICLLKLSSISSSIMSLSSDGLVNFHLPVCSPCESSIGWMGMSSCHIFRGLSFSGLKPVISRLRKSVLNWLFVCTTVIC